MIKHLNIKVFGSVQGVFFRISAKDMAEKLGIVGFAKNESDGTVYIEAEGEEKDLEKFVEWCKVGPPLAKVEKVEVTEGQLKNLTGFNRDFADY